MHESIVKNKVYSQHFGHKKVKFRSWPALSVYPSNTHTHSKSTQFGVWMWLHNADTGTQSTLLTHLTPLANKNKGSVCSSVKYRHVL